MSPTQKSQRAGKDLGKISTFLKDAKQLLKENLSNYTEYLLNKCSTYQEGNAERIYIFMHIHIIIYKFHCGQFLNTFIYLDYYVRKLHNTLIYSNNNLSSNKDVKSWE